MKEQNRFVLVSGTVRDTCLRTQSLYELRITWRWQELVQAVIKLGNTVKNSCQKTGKVVRTSSPF